MMANPAINFSQLNANIKKSPSSFKRFSECKFNTMSTAERVELEDSSSSDSSVISEFMPTDDKFEKMQVLNIVKNKSQQQLTFASIKYKQILLQRAQNFASTLQNLLKQIEKRKKALRENGKTPQIQANKNKKLTFLSLSQSLGKNNTYDYELNLQYSRIEQVSRCIQEFKINVSSVKGGFTEEEVIDLMNRINVIEGYCWELFHIVSNAHNVGKNALPSPCTSLK